MSRELERVAPSNREVLQRHLQSVPVKLGSLASDLGVSVKISNMKPGVSGQIRKEGDSYVIRVNRYEARERQRFTIAHELSHFLLHKPEIDKSPDGITDNVLYRSGAPEVIEFEANRLAAEIAMPKHLIDDRMRDFGGLVSDEVIESLAAEFEVSKAAMEIRLSSFQPA